MSNDMNEIEVDSDVKKLGVISQLVAFLQRPIENPLRKRASAPDGSEEVNTRTETRKWWEIEFGKAVPTSVLLQVTRQLAAFSAAGIPILDSLEMLTKSLKNKRMSATLTDVGDQIRNGASLSTAVASHPKVFPKYYAAILEASEQSGDLAVTFETLTSVSYTHLRAHET